MQLGSIFKSSMVYAFGNILTKAVGFLLLPFYTRYLSSAEYGTIELIELIINVTALIFGLGVIGGAMGRIYHEFEDSQSRKKVVSSCMLVTFIASAVVAVLGAATSPLISGMVLENNSYTGLISLSFAALVITNQAEICLVYLRIVNRAKLYVAATISQFAVMALLNVYFIGYRHLGVWGFVYSKLIVFAILLVFMLTVLVREVGFSVDLGITKKIVRFGAPMIGSAVAFFVIHFSDRFILQLYHGVSEVGIYSVSYKFAFLITYMVGEPFGRVWNVSLYAHVKDDDWKEKFANIFAYFVLALLTTWLMIACFSTEVIGIMVSRQFEAAAALVPLLALGYVFREIGDFYRQLMYINNWTGFSSRIAIFCAVVNVVANFALIAPYGATGAMWATLLTWLVYAGLFYFYSQKAFFLTYRRAIAGYVLIAIGLYVISWMMPLANGIAASTFHIVLFSTFVLWLLFGNYLTCKEKALFCEFFDMKIRRVIS